MDVLKRILSGRLVLGALSMAAVLLAYTPVTSQPDNNPALLHPIPDIIGSFFTNIEAGALQSALWASLYRIFLGFFIGTTCALIIGCLVGWYKMIEYLVGPLIEAIRPIPPLAYIPIIIIWFGIEEFSRVLLISIACFMVCVVNVVAGMKNVPQVYVDAASKAGQREVEAKWVEAVGLKGFEDRWPRELSGGMRKRVDIGRVYANDPDVLLMDEPCRALDAQTKEKLQSDLLDTWKETKKSVIFVNHDLEEAIFLSDQIVVMSARPGRIRHIETVSLPHRRNDEMRLTSEFWTSNGSSGVC